MSLLAICSKELSNIRLVVGCIGFNATLTANVISWRLVTHMRFLAFSHSTNTTFLFKATDYFSHMLLQR